MKVNCRLRVEGTQGLQQGIYGVGDGLGDSVKVIPEILLFNLCLLKLMISPTTSSII